MSRAGLLRSIFHFAPRIERLQSFHPRKRKDVRNFMPVILRGCHSRWTRSRLRSSRPSRFVFCCEFRPNRQGQHPLCLRRRADARRAAGSRWPSRGPRPLPFVLIMVWIFLRRRANRSNASVPFRGDSISRQKSTQGPSWWYVGLGRSASSCTPQSRAASLLAKTSIPLISGLFRATASRRA